ncbi:Protocatechuate 4,5-dioxygenase alpha chain [Roseivivax jejudonensis]|uniref:Protocatechuate 4,5-dioxygenase alpha chain n=1 Tax=Roseivivax jejudonensis TaxID=1529041 RepID=A0A1X7A5B7_9RHOB|nr:protocatechuate 3,4-dioxygenase [Roseivivax jejudonensis]SLN71010.1 Protocatechuate 4,5-dioxygenase alpha chain [Roseivivax jejudonensis]
MAQDNDDISARIAQDKATARSLEGTYLFDGARSGVNYPLNKMCMSLTSDANRKDFAADEDAYCDRYGVSPETKAMVLARDWIGLIRSGGNIYYVFKLAAIDHVSMQHVGAQQNAMSLDEFRAKLNGFKDADRPQITPETKGS